MTVQETETTAVHTVSFSGVTLVSLRVLMDLACCRLENQKFPGIEHPVSGLIMPPKWELETKKATVEVRVRNWQGPDESLYPKADLARLEMLVTDNNRWDCNYCGSGFSSTAADSVRGHLVCPNCKSNNSEQPGVIVRA